MNDGSKLKRAQERARESAIQGNEASTEYVKNMNAINGRIILMSLGSASLLITFVGILFDSTRNVSRLEYKYVIIAISCFIVCSLLLLLYSWFVSLFRFHGAVSYHNADKAAVAREEIAIAKENGIVDENGRLLSSQAKAEHLHQQVDAKEEIESLSTKNHKWSKWHYYLSNITLPIAYGILVTGYASTMLFFIEVINLLNAR